MVGILKKENQVVVTFGYGDIRITSGMIDGVAVLGLNQDVKNDIGSLSETVKTVHTLPKSDVYMVFNSLKSIETLILKLQHARSIVINNEDFDRTDGLENITDIYEQNSFLKG